MEEAGLECCLWPHLYWDKEYCETVIRGTDVRRLARVHGGFDRIPLWDDQDEDEEPLNAEDLTRNSLKRAFMDKVLGPIPGYGADFEHVQFVFDLWLWSDIGSKRNKFQHTPMRILVKGALWSPAYWKLRLAMLIHFQ